MQLVEFFLDKLLVPVKFCTRGQELLDLAPVLNLTDWAVLKPCKLLLLQLIDTVLEQLYLEVLLHHLLSL